MYSIEQIIKLENEVLQSENSFISYDIINHIYTLEYKFKDKRINNATKIENPIKFEDIRVNLNKLSKKTYNIHFKYIISSLHCLHNKSNPDLFANIYKHISSNNFMVEPYSKLSSSLIQIFPEYENIFYKKIDQTVKTIYDINLTYGTSYDELCEINKIKDNLRANFMFFSYTLIHLNNHNKYQECIFSLQSALQDNLKDETKKMHNELVSELILIVIKNSKILMFNLKSWRQIMENVEKILELKSDKEISRKVIFNHMDIHDINQKIT